MLLEFQSIIPVDVVRVKSYVNSLFNPTGVPMQVSVNKLNLIPERIVACRIAVFWNGGRLGSSKPYVSIEFFNPFMHRCSRLSNIDLATLAGNLVDYYAFAIAYNTRAYGQFSDLTQHLDHT